MAEGDTIHRLARRLGEVLCEGPLERASAPAARSPLRLQADRLAELVGRRLERADARGKHLLLRFEGDRTVHSHLGLRGSWRVARQGEGFGRSPGGAWLALVVPASQAAQFGGAHLAIRTEAELRSDARLRSLGPDVLAPDFTVAEGVAALRAAARERELGDALLDQRVMCGIGNVYRSEACFAARVSPWRRLADLADPELERVVGEAAALMRAGLETGGRPGDVYRRAGQPCLRCGEEIRSRGQGDANRTAHWCEHCQA